VVGKITFSEQAWKDADEIYDWIASRADPETAESYVSRIIDFCDSLREFPNRGSPRDDLAPGIRTNVFESRVVIAYAVSDDAVTIVRILNRGRDASRAFSS
jgi:toxin ParE1/3/4